MAAAAVCLLALSIFLFQCTEAFSPRTADIISPSSGNEQYNARDNITLTFNDEALSPTDRLPSQAGVSVSVSASASSTRATTTGVDNLSFWAQNTISPTNPSRTIRTLGLGRRNANLFDHQAPIPSHTPLNSTLSSGEKAAIFSATSVVIALLCVCVLLVHVRRSRQLEKMCLDAAMVELSLQKQKGKERDHDGDDYRHHHRPEVANPGYDYVELRENDSYNR